MNGWSIFLERWSPQMRLLEGMEGRESDSRNMALLVGKTMLLPSAQPLHQLCSRGISGRHGVVGVKCMAKDTGESGGSAAVEIAAAVAGLVANPVIGWSLYTLKTTGCGLPPGPGGVIGAVEGVSYLVVAGIVGWSVYTKVRTGTGLPAGQYGLLGAVEGVSYLTVLAIAVVFGLQFFEQGSIPGPLPSDQCFG